MSLIFPHLFQGLFFPASYAILRHWATPAERSRMGAILLTGTEKDMISSVQLSDSANFGSYNVGHSLAGIYLGPVIGLPVSGYITHFLQWQYLYYIFGKFLIFARKDVL